MVTKSKLNTTIKTKNGGNVVIIVNFTKDFDITWKNIWGWKEMVMSFHNNWYNNMRWQFCYFGELHSTSVTYTYGEKHFNRLIFLFPLIWKQILFSLSHKHWLVSNLISTQTNSAVQVLTMEELSLAYKNAIGTRRTSSQTKHRK